MYKHILVPTDGSELSASAEDQAFALARTLGARVTVLTVAEPLHILPVTPTQIVDLRNDYNVHLREQATRIHREAEAKAEAAGIAIDTVQVAASDPWQAIIDTAKSRGCDLIAMASHGRRGVSAFVMGSVTTKVLSHSKIPVLVYRS
jgi:nucleotide-binding universal stress UspA family protein